MQTVLMRDLFRAATAADASRDVIGAFVDAVWHHVCDMSTAQGWPYPKNLRGRELYRYLARLAVGQYIDPAIWAKCEACSGTGNGGICPTCRGKGTLFLEPPVLMAMMDMTPDAFERTWAPRVEQIVRIISYWQTTQPANADPSPVDESSSGVC